MPKTRDVAPGSVADRFRELIRALVKAGEKEAALAVFFNHSPTAISNWHNGFKLPRDGDIVESVAKCGISEDELRSQDAQLWKTALARAARQKHIIATPAWLYLKDRIAIVEQSTKTDTIIILTSDAYNDTQRRETQSVVRENILRGVNYIYIVPYNCPNERPLVRFIASLKSGNLQGSDRGTARIIRTLATKKAALQWKRIDHVMLFAHGGGVIESLSDLAHVQIDEGYEQLYKANDQPHGEYAWKALSIREMDYYKELLEEWELSPEDDEKEQQRMSPGEGRRRAGASGGTVETLRPRASGPKSDR
jgi:hypothetical protein